jgi:hypothetical protein
MPPTRKFKANNVWAQQAILGSAEQLTLPSGQTCLAKRIGMDGMLEAGILGEADSLTAYVGRKHVRRVRGAKGTPDGEQVNISSVMRDPEAIKAMVFLMDRAVPLIVVDPKVHLHFEFLDNGQTKMIPVEDREPGEVYTDQIGFEDKAYLFQYAVGGTRDLERFRQQSADAVAGVDNGEDVSVPAERSTRDRSSASRRR